MYSPDQKRLVAPIPQAEPLASAPEEVRGRVVSHRKQAFRRFLRNRAAVASLLFLLTAGFAAAFAPFLTHYSPIPLILDYNNINASASSHHWLGTDNVGRDVFTRLLYGLRGPLGVATVGSILCTLIGAITGIMAGFRGGWIDEVLTRITELIFVVPGILLIILFVTLYGHALDNFGVIGRYIMVTIFISTDSWPVIMRVARGEALRLRNEQFMEAAAVAGSSTWHMIRGHLLPNLGGVLIVQGAFLTAGFVYVTTALAIFGLGTPEPNPDIGTMLTLGAQAYSLNSVQLLAPCVVVTALIFAFTFVGDGMRDAFDVRGKYQ